MDGTEDAVSKAISDRLHNAFIARRPIDPEKVARELAGFGLPLDQMTFLVTEAAKRLGVKIRPR